MKAPTHEQREERIEAGEYAELSEDAEDTGEDSRHAKQEQHRWCLRLFGRRGQLLRRIVAAAHQPVGLVR